MSFALNLFLIGFSVVVVIWISLFTMHKKSYKYRAQIAVPVGESPNDVIWVDDHFKVRKQKGHMQVRFFKSKGKVYSPKFSFWGKWLKPKSKGDVVDNEGWATVNDPDFRKHLTRGAHFYKVSDLEYKVMKIDNRGDFKVLDHDSMELIIDDIERQNEISVSFRDKLIQLGMWLGSLIIIAALAIIIIVLTMKYSGERSAEIIQLAARAAASQAPVGG